MTYKFDIFPFIAKLNKGDSSAFENLSQDDKNQASPFMAMKFMSGCTDKSQIIMLNELVNTYIFRLNDKELMFKLLAASASGKVRSVKWPGQMRDPKNPGLEIISQFFDCSIREAKLMYQNYNINDIIGMAETLGYPDDEIKKLSKK